MMVVDVGEHNQVLWRRAQELEQVGEEIGVSVKIQRKKSS